MTVRCGNHPTPTEHATVTDVRACYAARYGVVDGPATRPPAPDSPRDVPTGRYAVTHRGELAFYRITRRPGWRYAKVARQAGPEFHPVYGTAAAAVLREIAAAGIESARRRYAREMRQCWRCGLPLTVEQSRDRGLGPVCAQKVDAAA